MREYHGWSDTPTYNSWYAMIRRCYDENDISYRYYGAIGITVCPRWRRSFLEFLADMGERPDGKTLDRKDHDKSYKPGNCRWATPKEQRANQPTRQRPKSNTAWLDKEKG